jgi:trk system potassium uptake protein TrkH
MSIWTDNMMSIQTAVIPNVAIMLTELAGGIGFFVLYDLTRHAKRVVRGVHPRSLTTHSKLALTVTGLVVTVGALVILLTEWPHTSLAKGNHVMAALFQSISASTTTGFNTVDIGALALPALFMLCILMFIGASPNSTGGGIKTTTLGVMAAGFWALLRGREDITLFRRRIPVRVLHSAYGLTLMAVTWCVVVIAVMLIVERASFMQIFFEVLSAFGNVGLSTGITTRLTELSRVLLSATMFFGRLGPLAIGFSLIGRRETPPHHYAEDEVFVG